MPQNRHGLCSTAVILVLALPTFVALPAAHAANPPASARAKSSAKTMAEQAGKAYETGDFQRAAQLYYNAWQTDDDTPDYLFAAARAAHVGGLLDVAVKYYQEFLKTDAIDAARAGKARGYLDDIGATKAAVKSQEAEKAERTDAALAAQLYLQALQLAPAHVEYQFRAAVALQSAARNAEAQELLKAYLAHAPADAVDRPEAQARLVSLQKSQPRPENAKTPASDGRQATSTKPQPVVPPPVPVTKPQPPAVVAPVAKQEADVAAPPGVTAPAVKGPSRVAGWILTIAGAGLMVGAGVAAAAQFTDTATYSNPNRDGNGLITSMTAAEGNALANKIDRNRAIAGVCGALGATSLGLGIWQLVRPGTPAATTTQTQWPVLLPTLDGAVLAGRF